MSLFISSLNSGSNGNCYYIGNQDEAVLIDGGISCRETEKRLKRLGLSLSSVKAIFVSHEHGDHIHGIPALCKKHKLPVYTTSLTMRDVRMEIDEKLILPFKAFETVKIGSLSVTGFPKFHDANDPHSFIVEGNGVTIGIFTDIGRLCDHVIKHFKQCHAAFLESNYDEEMLDGGRYPIYLKNRIRDGRGHLSNKEAAQLFVDHKPAFMSHLFLSHLSRNNNSPKIVKDLFTKIAGTTEIIIAPRDKETQLYHIRNNFRNSPLKMLIKKRSKSRTQHSQFQLSLFQ